MYARETVVSPTERLDARKSLMSACASVHVLFYSAYIYYVHDGYMCVSMCVCAGGGGIIIIYYNIL